MAQEAIEAQRLQAEIEADANTKILEMKKEQEKRRLEIEAKAANKPVVPASASGEQQPQARETKVQTLQKEESSIARLKREIMTDENGEQGMDGVQDEQRNVRQRPLVED